MVTTVVTAMQNKVVGLRSVQLQGDLVKRYGANQHTIFQLI